MKNDKQKVFLVFNTVSLGDLLLCNSLCQNIRLQYPDSKIVFIADKTFSYAAKIQKDVDDVVVYDKKGEHKGFWGLIKFLKDFKYKKSYCSFLTYTNTRNYLIALFSGSKNIIKASKNYGKMSERHSDMLRKFSGKDVMNLPIACNVKEVSLEKFDFLENKYIAICPVCENTEKDIPLEDTVEIIKEINNRGYKAVFTGVGDYSHKYADTVREKTDFIDLIDKTSISELAGILKSSMGLISADTGTMHLGCACGIPVVAMFYRENTIDKWAPDEKIYKSKTLFREKDPKKVCDALLEITEKQEVKI